MYILSLYSVMQSFLAILTPITSNSSNNSNTIDTTSHGEGLPVSMPMPIHILVEEDKESLLVDFMCVMNGLGHDESHYDVCVPMCVTIPIRVIMCIYVIICEQGYVFM